MARAIARGEVAATWHGRNLEISRASLAAARLRHLQFADLRARFDSSLPLLVGRPQDAPLRLQTMRTAITWSHDLLTPAQQACFRSLAVFLAGFESDAVVALQRRLSSAEQMHGDEVWMHGDVSSAVLESLSVLIDHSLLQIMPSTAPQPRLTTRDVFLDLIRALSWFWTRAGICTRPCSGPARSWRCQVA